MFINHGHNGIQGNTVIHREYLKMPCLTAFINGAFPVAGYAESAVSQFPGDLLNDLITMREKVTALTGLFARGTLRT